MLSRRAVTLFPTVTAKRSRLDGRRLYHTSAPPRGAGASTFVRWFKGGPTQVGAGLLVCATGVIATYPYLQNQTLLDEVTEEQTTSMQSNGRDQALRVAEYEAMERAIFATPGVMPSEDYEALGMVAREEVELTVVPHAFTQYGIVTPAGVGEMFASLHPPLAPDSTMVDIGSGVGNVLLETVALTPCRRTIGIDILPSRIRVSEAAERHAREMYPQVFTPQSAMEWWTGDVLQMMPRLGSSAVTHVFMHSWMFDDELMAGLADGLKQVPSLQCVVTSRALPGWGTGNDGWRVEKEATFEADWNPRSPFTVYTKDTAPR